MTRHQQRKRRRAKARWRAARALRRHLVIYYPERTQHYGTLMDTYNYLFNRRRKATP